MVTRRRIFCAASVAIVAVLSSMIASGENAEELRRHVSRVTDEILAHPSPDDWLTWRGTSKSLGYSALDQITRENAKNLEMQWVFQARSLEKFEATPLVVDGIMYITEPPNNVLALDAKTGAVLWRQPTRNAIGGGVLTYRAAGRQLVAVAAGFKSRVWPVPAESNRVIVFGVAAQ